MLNFKIYYWHKYKTTNKNQRKKDLIQLKKLLKLLKLK